MSEMKIEIHRIDSWYGKLITKDGLSAKCPTCGVTSNLFPCYENSEVTSVNQVLGYCGHNAEGHFEVREKL